MRLLGLDCETTGFDPEKDRITELGTVIWDTDTKSPIYLSTEYYWDETYPPLSAENVSVTGITEHTLKEFGAKPIDRLNRLNRNIALHNISYIVAHNGNAFDRLFLDHELRRANISGSLLLEIPWIDTRTDLPFGKDPESRKLRHLATDHGFLNPFEHRAVFDVLTMLKIMSNYSIEEILQYRAIPTLTIQAMVNYDNRQQAKDHKFSWEKCGDKTYPKSWVKQVKTNSFEEEKKKYPFEIKQL